MVAVIIAVTWIGVAALWVRSYWRGDGVLIDRPDSPWDTFALISGRGGICIGYRHWPHIPVGRIPTEMPVWAAFDNPVYPEPTMWNVVMVRMGMLTIAGSPLRKVGAGTLVLSLTTGTTTAPSPSGQPLTLTMPNTPTRVQPTSFPAPAMITVAGPGPTSLPSAMIGALAQPSIPLTTKSQFLFYSTSQFGPSDITRVAILPYWALLAAISIPALLPALMILQFLRRRQRIREGCCLNCGYDLRATPDCCPECGTVPSPGGQHA